MSDDEGWTIRDDIAAGIHSAAQRNPKPSVSTLEDYYKTMGHIARGIGGIGALVWFAADGTMWTAPVGTPWPLHGHPADAWMRIKP